MIEFIEKWPKKIMSFDEYIAVHLQKRAKEGQQIAQKKFKATCRYCRRNFDDFGLDRTKDHVVPLSRGGLDHKENRVDCCYGCNQWKKDRPLHIWLKEIERLIKQKKIYSNEYTIQRMELMGVNIKRVLDEVKRNEKKASKYKVKKKD